MADNRCVEGDRETVGYGVVADLLTDVGSVHDMDQLVWLSATAALTVVAATSASVSRYDAEAGSVRTLVNVGELGPGEVEHPADERYRVSDFPNLLKLAEQQQPWSLHRDDPDGDRNEHALLRSLDKSASLGCPIILGTRVWGEVYVTRDADQPPFDARDRAAARVLAQATALCIDRLNSHNELEELVYIDALTGVGNRRLADQTLERLARRHVPVTVALWVVDGLKRVNDRDGHPAGDRLLRGTALLLSEAVSGLPEAVAARMGGDEFCLIAVGPVHGQVADLIDELVVRADAFAAGAGASCGIASASELSDAAGIRALLRRADAALYRAKRAGGRRQVHDPE